VRNHNITRSLRMQKNIADSSHCIWRTDCSTLKNQLKINETLKTKHTMQHQSALIIVSCEKRKHRMMNQKTSQTSICQSNFSQQHLFNASIHFVQILWMMFHEAAGEKAALWKSGRWQIKGSNNSECNLTEPQSKTMTNWMVSHLSKPRRSAWHAVGPATKCRSPCLSYSGWI